ncbi:MAG: GNAT family N-acetyltransferase [Pseudomonadota bacterium]
MNRTVPTINTARLTLRAMRPGDFDRFAEIWAMPAVVRHIDGAPRDRAKSWDQFLRNEGHWQMTGFGQWAIEDHATKDMVGQVGFFLKDRGLEAEWDRVPEAGWVLVPDLHGQGLGREAVRAAHEWFDRVITGPTACLIHPENAASLRLAERLGYSTVNTLTYCDAPACMLLRKSVPQG